MENIRNYLFNLMFRKLVYRRRKLHVYDRLRKRLLGTVTYSMVLYELLAQCNHSVAGSVVPGV